MQPALPMFGIFPPPTAGADVFAFFDGTGAGLTAYREESFVVETVVGNVVGFYKILNVVLTPINQGIEFDDVVILVVLNKLHIFARYRLRAAETRNPHFQTLQGTFQRFNFADLTTEVAFLYRLIKKVDAVFRYHLFNFLVIRKIYLQFYAVTHICIVDERIGFGEKPARVEGENLRRLVDRAN